MTTVESYISFSYLLRIIGFSEIEARKHPSGSTGAQSVKWLTPIGTIRMYGYRLYAGRNSPRAHRFPTFLLPSQSVSPDGRFIDTGTKSAIGVDYAAFVGWFFYVPHFLRYRI